MICEDTSRFVILYDFITDKPFYNKKNCLFWSSKDNCWATPLDEIYEVPLDFISPNYLKRYIDNKLSLFIEPENGTLYIPFKFFAERLCVGILLQRHPINIEDKQNILPKWLKGFKHIFPQNANIFFV
jgi:hypothetical protein